MKLEPGYSHIVHTLSLPVRGAWIEIALDEKVNALMEVAPRKGSVD